MSEIDRIIKEDYIPHLIGSGYSHLESELRDWNKEDFIDFFIVFEQQVKKKREQLILIDTKNNLN